MGYLERISEPNSREGNSMCAGHAFASDTALLALASTGLLCCQHTPSFHLWMAGCGEGKKGRMPWEGLFPVPFTPLLGTNTEQRV